MTFNIIKFACSSPHMISKDLRLRILGKLENSEGYQIWVGAQPSPQSPFQK